MWKAYLNGKTVSIATLFLVVLGTSMYLRTAKQPFVAQMPPPQGGGGCWGSIHCDAVPLAELGGTCGEEITCCQNCESSSQCQFGSPTVISRMCVSQYQCINGFCGIPGNPPTPPPPPPPTPPPPPPPPTQPQCGNGSVEAGEECDDGNQNPTDACTDVCKEAVCGDLIVRSGVEECDIGAGGVTAQAQAAYEQALQNGPPIPSDIVGALQAPCDRGCEVPQCSDGQDNDGDGTIDAGDPGCHVPLQFSSVTLRFFARLLGQVGAFVPGRDSEVNPAGGGGGPGGGVGGAVGGGGIVGGDGGIVAGNCGNLEWSCSNGAGYDPPPRPGGAVPGGSCQAIRDYGEDLHDACEAACPGQCSLHQTGFDWQCDGNQCFPESYWACAGCEPTETPCSSGCDKCGCSGGSSSRRSSSRSQSSRISSRSSTQSSKSDGGKGSDSSRSKRSSQSSSSVGALCGNGKMDPGEECDKGKDNTDGGYREGRGGATTAACRTNCKWGRCGDGAIDIRQDQNGRCPTDPKIGCAMEECDDANTTNNDGCSNTCFAARCGDGIVQNGDWDGIGHQEECDDGNRTSGDGCDWLCKKDAVAGPNTCGDGVPDYKGKDGIFGTDDDEECDMGSMNSNHLGSSCRTDCTIARCGDGIVQKDRGEECDDGSQCDNGEQCGCGGIFVGVPPMTCCADKSMCLYRSGDGCSGACRLEKETKAGSCDPLACFLKGNEFCAKDGKTCATTSALPCIKCEGGSSSSKKSGTVGGSLPPPPIPPQSSSTRQTPPPPSPTPPPPSPVPPPPPGPPPPVPGICGNGILNTGEECEFGIPCAGGKICNATQCSCGTTSPPVPPPPPTPTPPPPTGPTPPPPTGPTPPPPSPTPPPPSPGPTSGCGNGTLDAGEQCEDANRINGDGCTSECIIEPGITPACGDGAITANEQCDDHNVFGGDGCSVTCRREGCQTSAECPLGAECTNGDCTLCTANTQCQSGLCVQGECVGCQTNAECPLGASCIDGSCSTCTTGLQCNSNQCVGNTCQILTATTCGNRVLEPGEQCEDGNRRSGDGCNSSCFLEAGFTQKCGDGVLVKEEECDDSNRREFDGCSAQCLLEFGVCGDGIVQKLLGEQCEESLHDPGLPYRCGADCRFLSLFCGNSVLDAGEECDEGVLNNDMAADACRTNCSRARCGDRVLDENETCDDGNRLRDDGCDRFCRREGLAAAPSVAANVIELPAQPGMPPPSGNNSLPPSVTTIARTKPPIGETGPAAVAVMAAGAAAGFGWMRRRKKL